MSFRRLPFGFTIDPAIQVAVDLRRHFDRPRREHVDLSNEASGHRALQRRRRVRTNSVGPVLVSSRYALGHPRRLDRSKARHEVRPRAPVRVGGPPRSRSDDDRPRTDAIRDRRSGPREGLSRKEGDERASRGNRLGRHRAPHDCGDPVAKMHRDRAVSNGHRRRSRDRTAGRCQRRDNRRSAGRIPVAGHPRVSAHYARWPLPEEPQSRLLECGRGGLRAPSPGLQALQPVRSLDQQGEIVMNLEGNTVLITGGNSGIGRALAEALHARGNKVIIAGRRKEALADTVRANPGMVSFELDVTDPSSVATVSAELLRRHLRLNVLINNAGIMKVDDVARAIDEELVASTIATNLVAPIRLTGALLEHLKSQPSATIINVSSVLGFVPLAWSGVYSSTKAALHSYSLSLRYKLRDTSVRVLELVPPWVQTDLLGSQNRNDPRAMPLDEFTAEVLRLLATDVEEIVVEKAKPLRENVGPHEGQIVNRINDLVAAVH